MADQENLIPTPIRTRASKKRLNESVEGISVSKKRVVLGELTNISSDAAGLALKSAPSKSPKPVLVPEPEQKIGVLVDKKTSTEIDVNVDFHVSPETDESEKYRHAPLMFRHLHSLEVIFFLFLSIITNLVLSILEILLLICTRPFEFEAVCIQFWDFRVYLFIYYFFSIH